MRSKHQSLVNQFMRKAQQDLPSTPCIPSEEVRLLRAKLIYEESLETIRGLGVDIFGPSASIALTDDEAEDYMTFKISKQRDPDIVEIADGCADIKVVTTGTLSACGIQDEPIQDEVDRANLRKFAPGGHRREDGKWIKPPNWQPPDIIGKLKEQGYHPKD